MLSDAEFELERELGAVRAELIRERRARELRSEVAELGASTSGESDRLGVANVIAGGASAIFSAGWAMVAYVDDSMVRIVHGPGVPTGIAADWVEVPLDTPIPLCDILRGETDSIELTDRSQFTPWPDMVEEADRAQMGSVVFRRVPVASDEPAAIAVAWPDSHEMDGLEHELLDLLVRTAAPAFSRSGRTEVAGEMARTLQEWLLESTVFDIPGVDAEVLYQPGSNHLDVGGDWYDVVELGDGRSAVVVGDVVGHDVQAAVAMSQVRHVLAANLVALDDVAAALDLTDQYLRRRTHRTMATAVVIVFGADGEVTMASAGHPPPLVVGPDGEPSPAAIAIDPPLGSGLATYRCTTVEMAPDTTIMAYTDGVVERRGENVDVGIEALRTRFASLVNEAAESSAPVAQTVVARLREHLAATKLDDDTAAVVMRIAPGPF